MSKLIRNTFAFSLCGYLFLSAAFAEPAAEKPGMLEACKKLANFSKEETKRCMEYTDLLELDVSVVENCRGFSQSVESRVNCVKSGAAQEMMKQCKSLKWSEQNTLTCFRSAQNKETIKLCQKFSNDEDTQVSCLRYGRELALIEACSRISNKNEDKLQCLSIDAPAQNTRECVRTQKSVNGRMECLKKNHETTEKDYQSDMKAARARILPDRTIASERK